MLIGALGEVMMGDWRERIIQERFGGDEQKFEKAYEEAVQESISEAVSWKDLHLNATVLPDLEEKTHNLLENRLGYRPHRSVLWKLEPYLRGLVQAWLQGTLSSEDFSAQADEHIKHIRNEDMKHHSYDEHPTEYQNTYRHLFKLYGYRGKERLARFLGYEPDLKYSLMGELWLWEVMAKDIQLGEKITSIDYKALTIIRYREILFSEGEAAAKASQLVPSVVA